MSAGGANPILSPDFSTSDKTQLNLPSKPPTISHSFVILNLLHASPYQYPLRPSFPIVPPIQIVDYVALLAKYLSEFQRAYRRFRFTVIVVSHVDLIVHQDTTELVNVVDSKHWQQYYHACTFTVGREIRSDAGITIYNIVVFTNEPRQCAGALHQADVPMD